MMSVSPYVHFNPWGLSMETSMLVLLLAPLIACRLTSSENSEISDNCVSFQPYIEHLLSQFQIHGYGR